MYRVNNYTGTLYECCMSVVSYSCFMFPWADASSASLARSSMKFSFSVFMLFLTALFASVHFLYTSFPYNSREVNINVPVQFF